MLARRQFHQALFDDRGAVPGVVVTIAAAEVPLAAGPREAGAAKAVPRLRVDDLAQRRADVIGPAAAAADLHGEAAVAGAHAAGRAPFLRRRAGIEGEVAVDASDGGRRNVCGYEVIHAAD